MCFCALRITRHGVIRTRLVLSHSYHTYRELSRHRVHTTPRKTGHRYRFGLPSHKSPSHATDQLPLAPGSLRVLHPSSNQPTIWLRTGATPNGHRRASSRTTSRPCTVSKTRALDFITNDQKEPWFLGMHSNGRIPAHCMTTEAESQGVERHRLLHRSPDLSYLSHLHPPRDGQRGRRCRVPQSDATATKLLNSRRRHRGDPKEATNAGTTHPSGRS